MARQAARTVADDCLLTHEIRRLSGTTLAVDTRCFSSSVGTSCRLHTGQRERGSASGW